MTNGSALNHDTSCKFTSSVQSTKQKKKNFLKDVKSTVVILTAIFHMGLLWEQILFF